MASTTIGEQLKRLRTERGLSQAGLAERADVSVDLVKKLEQGIRESARITSLTRLAQALDVPMSALLDRRPRLDRSADEASLLRIRDVLLDPGALAGFDTAEDAAEPRPAGELNAAIRAGWEHYWMGRFGLLAAALPGLIGEARGMAGPGGAGPLAQAYQLAATLHVHMGAEDLAAIAAERGVAAAARGDDELQWAHLHGTYAWVMLAQGRLAESERHAAWMAKRIEPSLSTASAAQLTTWGALLLTAQAPAAIRGREVEALEYISLARACAEARRDDAWHYQTNCGVSSVAMQATYAHITLGHPKRALEAAKDVRREDLRAISWGRFLLDVAQAQIELRRDETALGTLHAAHDMSPEWFRHQICARAMVTDLIERRRRLPPALRSLAQALEPATSRV